MLLTRHVGKGSRVGLVVTSHKQITKIHAKTFDARSPVALLLLAAETK